MKTIFMSLLIIAGAAKADSDIFKNIMNLPSEQVGFADAKTHQKFLKRFLRHRKYSQKIIDLSNLRWADQNGDRCLTANEYHMFLEAEKLWKKAPRAMRENQLKAFLTEYFLGAFVQGNKSQYVDEVKKIEAQSDLDALYLLWNSVVKGKWQGEDASFSPEEVEYFADSWRTFRITPSSEIHSYLDEQVKQIKVCHTLPGPKQGAEVFDPLTKAKDVATIIEAQLDTLKDVGQWTGKAGPAAFFGALYGKTKVKEYLNLSLKIFDDIEKTYPTLKPNYGLLEGTTGIGSSALFAYKMSGEKAFLKIAERFADMTILNDANDHAEGAAGIGMFKLNLYLITKNERWLDEAREAADLIVERAIVKKGQAWWIMIKDFPTVFAGFGHGSAGIGYFLIHLYELTGNDIYKTFAEKAAEHVIQTAYHDEKGNMHWTWYQPAMGYATAWKYQWSHGNFGIAYFFDSLKRITPARKWEKAFERTMVPALEKAIEYRFDEGGACCGKAGQGDLYLTLYRETHDQKYLELAKNAARYLVDENGKVKEAFGRTPAKYDMSYSGLAGIGLYFLQLADPLASDLPYQVYKH